MTDQIFDLIKQEEVRQQQMIELIPSENYVSPEVREAVGSILMNKYAEGQPGRRYYQGNEVVDQIERECERRVLETFNLDESQWGVNVQPHSGCEANLIVYNALLDPGDKILSMFLPDGGHLSHGWHSADKKFTLVSKLYQVSFYKVDAKTQVFDYEIVRQQALASQPRLIVSGGTAYAREIDHQKMAAIAHEVGAYYLADVSHEAGLIAAGVQQSPFNYADVVTFTTHKTLRGPRGAVIVAKRNFSLGGDYDEPEDLLSMVDFSVIPGVQGGPHLHTIAGIAVALAEIQKPEFKIYAQQVIINAQVFAREFVKAGFNVVSGGTDKHLILLDMRDSGVDAWTAAWALELAGIVLNRNTVPGETASAYYPSGIRMGTPAITTRGMKEAECRQIATWIIEVMLYSKKWQMPVDKESRRTYIKTVREEMKKDKKLATVKNLVLKLTKKYPLFSWK